MDRIVALHSYLADAQTRALELGQFDCAIFVGGWVDQLLGTTWVCDWQGRYQSIAEGRALLKARGISGLRALADQELHSVGGWAFAQPGDVALIKDQTFCFGLVGCGGVIYVVSPAHGLDVIPMDRAWEVYRP